MALLRLNPFFGDSNHELSTITQSVGPDRSLAKVFVSQLQQRWQKDTLELKPDLLSILVGVNDHGRGVPMEDLGRSSSLDKITHCSLDDFLFFGSG